MKLLICTQKVDKNDPILGFFHRWIEEFAKHCEYVTVICLEKGEYNLPKNVAVLSLGKEEGVSKLTYMGRFYEFIFKERRNYDRVFVHMNQEYVLLGAVAWKLFGKKVSMWRNHSKGNVLTRLAVIMSNRVFYTSAYSYTAKFKKASMMPVGIDTKVFTPDPATLIPQTVLFLGRVSPIKNAHIFIRALSLLDTKNISFKANIYGDPGAKDGEYYQKVQDDAKELIQKGKVQFFKGISNDKTPALYAKHDIFVNATVSGSFDKTIIEAMACGCVVVASNHSLKDMISQEFWFEEGDAESLSERIKTALSLSSKQREDVTKSTCLRAREHDITLLVSKLISALR